MGKRAYCDDDEYYNEWERDEYDGRKRDRRGVREARMKKSNEKEKFFNPTVDDWNDE